MKLKWMRLFLVGMLAVGMLAACGDDDDEDAEGGDTTEEVEPSKFTVKTSEYAFQFASTTVRGGLVELTLDNTAGKESHEADLVRIDPGKTIADVRAASPDAAPPAWLHPEGGPGPVEPGKTAVYTANLAEGTYVARCNIPAPDGKAHYEKGMMTEIKVESGTDGEVPAGDVKVEAKDFDFTNLDKLKAGSQTVRVENTGAEPHFWAMAALAPGKTAGDLAAFFGGQAPPGPPPFTAFPGLVSTLLPGKHAARTLDLKSGTTYVMVCLITSPDGQSHAQKGMLKEFKIT